MEVQPHSVKCYIFVRSNVNVSFGQMSNAPSPMISFHQVFNGAGEWTGNPRKLFYCIFSPKSPKKHHKLLFSTNHGYYITNMRIPAIGKFPLICILHNRGNVLHQFLSFIRKQRRNWANPRSLRQFAQSTLQIRISSAFSASAQEINLVPNCRV